MPLVTRLWPHERVAWASVTLAALITAASVSFLRVHDQAPMAALGRFQIALPAGSLTFTLSPDGRNLAFIAPGFNGRTRTLWIRSMDSLEPRALPGTENTLTQPFWSPDSRFVAFWAGGKLKKIDVTGGLPQIICEAPLAVLGGTWNRRRPNHAGVGGWRCRDAAHHHVAQSVPRFSLISSGRASFCVSALFPRWEPRDLRRRARCHARAAEYPTTARHFPHARVCPIA